MRMVSNKFVDRNSRYVVDFNGKVKAWVKGVEFEDKAKEQAHNIASMPFIFNHIAIMPDVHWGMGATVGSVIPTQGAIIPAAVGVDIGCGMMAARLPFNIDKIEDLPKLRSSIERSVPVGFNQHKEPIIHLNDINRLSASKPEVKDKTFTKALCQAGTLGGGNHFIEICHDQVGDAWIALHSGSRNIGKALAEHYIDKAKGICKQYFISLPDPDLAYLAQDTADFDSYIKALLWAQDYAKLNRNTMMSLILKDLSYHMTGEPDKIEPMQVINCHHNYSQLENHYHKNIWVTRKGAVSAREGEWGIIPGSMGNRSYIVQGKGNIESFCSCSHGAGRKMSRNEAKKKFTVEDHIKATDGVECRKDSDVIDETPGAYKDIDAVMAAQSDLVDIRYTLKQVLCIKG